MLVGECSQRNRYSLVRLYIDENERTSVPAEIGQLTSLRELNLQNMISGNGRWTCRRRR